MCTSKTNAKKPRLDEVILLYYKMSKKSISAGRAACGLFRFGILAPRSSDQPLRGYDRWIEPSPQQNKNHPLGGIHFVGGDEATRFELLREIAEWFIENQHVDCVGSTDMASSRVLKQPYSY